ncbi:MAG: ATP-binding protein [Leptolyngbyaceae cyanobacterium RM1_406_9]|nr:ATP-binding protein [Leptolyngbyaceae cyanobacterium RM1_406_9]
MDAQVTHSIQFLQRQAASLLIYQSVLHSEVGVAFLNLLQSLRHPDPDGVNCLRAYGDWFNALAIQRQSWQDHLLTQLLRAENPFSQQAQRTDLVSLPPPLLAAAQHDLQVLQHLYACNGQQLSQWVQAAAALPVVPTAWNQTRTGHPQSGLEGIRKLPLWVKLEGIEDWSGVLEDLAAYYRKAGAGLFSEYRALRWQSGKLTGIPYPDLVRLKELKGYEAQQETLIKNTEALLAGYPALHVLLYGSRGSGKSSLVKAMLPRYAEQGLRLIEVAKSDLRDLPAIVDQLRGVPQKFIIFVDDLSFEEDEDAYKALKVVLEGNLTARPQNMVVYATSNRRHLIREFFGDRPRPSDADEIHNWDTVQEKLSFSDRFGLTLTFEPADQKTYLAIVHHLATLAEIPLTTQELEFQALQWATRHNGRSGRTARQFIDSLIPQTRHRSRLE